MNRWRVRACVKCGAQSFPEGMHKHRDSPLGMGEGVWCDGEFKSFGVVERSVLLAERARSAKLAEALRGLIVLGEERYVPNTLALAALIEYEEGEASDD